MANEFHGTRSEGLGQRKVLPWLPRPPQEAWSNEKHKWLSSSYVYSICEKIVMTLWGITFHRLKLSQNNSNRPQMAAILSRRSGYCF
eukprot:scaffold219105_cov17-Prasinocladus_malaysianus.AAC.1